MSATISPADVASCALQHYHSILPNHGKPQSATEWTVYAALIVSLKSKAPYVVSAATGSKCTTPSNDEHAELQKAYCLGDLHAEVLVKRGFQRVLWKEISSGKLELLEQLEDGTYSLRENASLHLYISDSPCGDASIYPLSNGDTSFTGAKLIGTSSATSSATPLPCSVDSNCQIVREPSEQVLGQLRTKSGRSNLAVEQRCTSLSCSDKLLRWNVMGLQGSCIRSKPIRLSSVVVSQDPKSQQGQQQALDRAIVQRTSDVVRELKQQRGNPHDEFVKQLESHLIQVHVVDQVYENAKSQVVIPPAVATAIDEEPNVNGKRSLGDSSAKRKRSFPCGYSLNWQIHEPSTEVLVGARGTKQCTKKNKHDYEKIGSRLSRMALYQLSGSSETKATTTYRQSKESMTLHADWKGAVLSTTPLQAWIRSSRDFDLSMRVPSVSSDK